MKSENVFGLKAHIGVSFNCRCHFCSLLVLFIFFLLLKDHSGRKISFFQINLLRFSLLRLVNNYKTALKVRIEIAFEEEEAVSFLIETYNPTPRCLLIFLLKVHKPEKNGEPQKKKWTT